MKEKILCIQLKQIGDVLMITPAMSAARPLLTVLSSAMDGWYL